jgi:hypothetical protein
LCEERTKKKKQASTGREVRVEAGWNQKTVPVSALVGEQTKTKEEGNGKC